MNNLVTIAGLNAYEYIPTSTKRLPVLLFLPGIGETGTDPKGLLQYGPSYFINSGWLPTDMIIVSVQPTVPWANPQYVDNIVNAVNIKYKDQSEGRLFATGLSSGAYAIQNYIGYSQAYSDKITAIVSMSAPEPETYFNGAYFDQPAWGFCGNQDSWYDKMSALYGKYSKNFTAYNGGHCCWNTYYDPNYKGSPNGSNIYTWLQAQAGTITPPIDNKPKTVTLTPGTDGGYYGSLKGQVNPGDTIQLSGNFSYVNLSDIVGTTDKRITITIQGTIGGYSAYAFITTNSSYFDIKGGNINGGTTGTQGPGLAFNHSNNFTVTGVDISNVSVGIMAKTTPSCDPSTYGDNWSYDNIVIQSNNIHDTTGEGMYIGHSESGLVTITCNNIDSQVYALRVTNLIIDSNNLSNIGWDGIQVTCGVNISITNNNISNYGVANITYQNMGIITASNGLKITGNNISNGTATAITTGSNGDCEIGNNNITNVGGVNMDAIYINSHKIKDYPPLKPNIHDNTITNTSRNCIRVANTDNYMVQGTISSNKYKGCLPILDNSESVLTNNTEITDSTNPPIYPYPVAILMSDGTQLAIQKN